jgi:hypothetical protein
MSNSGKYKDNLNFFAGIMDLLRKINQNLGDAEKNKERVKAICTSFSVLASQ